MNTDLTKSMVKMQGEMAKNILSELCDMMMELDDPSTNDEKLSYFIDYDTQDIFHAITILFMAGSNYASKNGIMTKDNVEQKVKRFKDVMLDTFGVDVDKESMIYNMLNEIGEDED